MLAREFRSCLKDPRRLIFIFGASIAYLFLFGMLYQPNIVQRIPTIICDEDQSSFSRQLVQSFYDSDSFEIVGFARDQEEMLDSIHRKESLVAIQIPRDFSSAPEILYLVNGSNIIVTNVTSSATLDILESLENSLIHSRARVLYNPTQGYIGFFLIGLAMVAFQQGMIFSIGAASFDKTPLAPRIFFYWILSMISFALVILSIENFVGIDLRAPIDRVFILGAIFSLTALSFGSFLASFFDREIDFIRASILYPVPAFILSGYTFPLESMPDSMQILARFFPLTYFSNDMRDLFLIGESPTFSHDVTILAIMGGIFCAITVVRNKSKIIDE